ncbi:hypothetical protein ZOSMA_83G00170 [Zostera marina]|uniref:FLZ-type domain-containing protein n=1 Tax=Zostera marina TaxID=29655 RepID=A0A0K9NLK5_ZOSMR|nr:hypothetical protein ZOSMA_83G00170 [Zostera marina]
MSREKGQLWARRCWKSQEQNNGGLKIALVKSSCIDTTTCIHRSSPITPTTPFSYNISEFQTAFFLRSCNMCDKKLDGEDIYIYRGEKAFCSMECRSWQILADEYREDRHGSNSLI